MKFGSRIGANRSDEAKPSWIMAVADLMGYSTCMDGVMRYMVGVGFGSVLFV